MIFDLGYQDDEFVLLERQEPAGKLRKITVSGRKAPEIDGKRKQYFGPEYCFYEIAGIPRN